MFPKQEAIAAIRQWGYPLQSKAGLQPIFDAIGDARIVLLGEASHGTHEYYTWRAHITRYLVEEKGFSCIAVEGDWPDAYRLNRFIKGYDTDNKSAYKVLQGFQRWPTWMWANWEIVALADWLQDHNKALPADGKVGFYGLDVYSLWESLDNILGYLRKADPAALPAAEAAFQCFEPYRAEEGRAYARASQLVPEICQQEVVELLKMIRQRLPLYDSDYEHVFNLEQNALVAVHAEQYYRAMVRGGAASWNLRDRHMAETLERLLTFHGPDSKIVVWAHNSHIGDSRATTMTDDGLLNLGELVRLKHNEKGVFLVGFGAYRGSVIAGKRWGAPMQEMDLAVPPEDSWEALLHEARPADQFLISADLLDNAALAEHHIGHRAIGVVYHSHLEKYGNYVPSILPLRYDAFVYFDATRALHPMPVGVDKTQIPETFPFGV
jgi:erythromycin esterase